MHIGLHINLTRSLLAVNGLQQRLNTGLPRREWILKEEVITTYRMLLRLYTKVLKSKKVPTASESLPPLRTCGPELAALRGKTPKTIKRHRKVLQDVGLIEVDKFRGSHQPFELTFNPAYLGLVEPSSLEQAEAAILRINQKMEAESIHSSSSADKLSPLTDVPGPSSNLYKRGQSIKGTSSAPSDGLLREADLDHVQEHGPDHTKQDAGFGRNAHEKMSPARKKWGFGSGKEVPKSSAAAEIDLNVQLLWSKAKSLLWPHKRYPDHKVLETKRMIRKLYEAVPPAELAYWHNAFTQSVGCAHSYIHKEPANRFAPVPWKWFDRSFKQGFLGALNWQRKREGYQKVWRANSAFIRIQQKYERNFNAPKSKQRPCKIVYQECLDTMARHDRPDLVAQFNQFVIAINEGYNAKINRCPAATTEPAGKLSQISKTQTTCHTSQI